MDANFVTLMGNLTSDPETRFTNNGTAVANFTLACTDRRYNSETSSWEDGNTSFFRIAAFGLIAENIDDSLRMGHRAIVVGKMQQKTYETADGDKRTVYDIQAHEVGASLQFATMAPKKRTGNPKPVAQDEEASTPRKAAAPRRTTAARSK